MKKIMVINIDNGNILVEKGGLASNFFTRCKGLLGKKEMPPGEGLVLYPCNMVHSIGMQIVIDVLFVSRDNQVIYIIKEMAPNRISDLVNNAHYVVELPAGQACRTGTAIGQKISVIHGELVN